MTWWMHESRIMSALCIILFFFFFSSRRRHTISVSAFLLNRSSDLLMVGLSFLTLSRWQIGRAVQQECRTALPGSAGMPRSEERRVGKESRSRWSRYHYQKKLTYYTIRSALTGPSGELLYACLLERT